MTDTAMLKKQIGLQATRLAECIRKINELTSDLHHAREENKRLREARDPALRIVEHGDIPALPERELLREALDALQGLHDDVVEYVTLNNLHDADGSPAINNHWMRRARAAADKIRAGLKEGEANG